MSYETITQVKRTLFVAECPNCHDRQENTEKAAKAFYCMPCAVWVPFEEVSYTGPNIK